MQQELDVRAMPIRRAVFWLVVGLALLIVSSRILVWGAVEIAHGFGVSDLIIGLTVVAVGTSLPELASSIIAARKGEHDIALGNILGSNLFNTLAVVGIAGTIHPLAVGPEVFNRDMLVMAALTLSLFVIGYGFRGPGRINRIEGAVLLVCYVGYTAYLISTVLAGSIGQFDSRLGTEPASENWIRSCCCSTPGIRFYCKPVTLVRCREIRGENRFSGRVGGKWLCEMTSAFIIKELRGARALRLFCGRSAFPPPIAKATSQYSEVAFLRSGQGFRGRS